MGYGNLPLEEIPTEQLLIEIKRRYDAVAALKCHYCGRKKGEEPACKLKDVHEGKTV